MKISNETGKLKKCGKCPNPKYRCTPYKFEFNFYKFEFDCYGIFEWFKNEGELVWFQQFLNHRNLSRKHWHKNNDKFYRKNGFCVVDYKNGKIIHEECFSDKDGKISWFTS